MGVLDGVGIAKEKFWSPRLKCSAGKAFIGKYFCSSEEY
jgi:hypothetical protein